MTRFPLVLALLALPAAAQKQANAPLLPPQWDRGLHAPGLDVAGECVEIYDDGSGPALYVAGAFETAGAVLADGLARFDGTRWEAIDVPWRLGSISAMEVYDDGLGDRLFVAGDMEVAFIRYIAAFDGTSWVLWPIRNGRTLGRLNALYSDGASLYIGGAFDFIAGTSVRNIARYDGNWHAMSTQVGAGAIPFVSAITESAAQGPNRLYAATQSAPWLAWWDGAAWQPVAGAPAFIEDMVDYSTTGGPELVLAVSNAQLTSLTPTGFIPFNATAPFDASALGTRIVEGTPRLYVGGSFANAGGTTVNSLTYWDRTAWRTLGGTGLERGGSHGSANDLVFGDLGNGTELFVTGSFEAAGGRRASHVARFGAGGARSLSGGSDLQASVEGFVEFDDGGGNAVYAFGSFDSTSVSAPGSVARFENGVWEIPSIPPLNDFATTIHDAIVFDDGSGPAVYFAGENFEPSPGFGGVLEWDGTSITNLPTTMSSVEAIEVFDDGSGPTLYIGGYSLPTNPGATVAELQRLEAGVWVPFGSVQGDSVLAIEAWAHDDGSSELYIGGVITGAGGVAGSNVMSWDGTSWDDMNGGVDAPVDALTAVDLPAVGGERLLVGGSFGASGPVTVSGGLARWTGSSWDSDLGLPADRCDDAVQWDDGSGPKLYVLAQRGQPLRRDLHVLTNAGWQLAPPATGVQTDVVHDLFVQGQGVGSSLWVGGDFSQIFGARASANVARLYRLRSPAELVPLGGGTLSTESSAFTWEGHVDPATAEIVLSWDPSLRGIVLLGRGVERAGPDGEQLRVTSVIATTLANGETNELRGTLPEGEGSSSFAQAVTIDPVTGRVHWTDVIEILPSRSSE